MCRESREEEGQDGRKGASFFFHLQNISGKTLGEVDSMGIYVLVMQSKAEGTIMSATGINSKSSKAIFRIFRPVKKSKTSNLESPGNKEGQSCSFAVALVLKEGHYARMRGLAFDRLIIILFLRFFVFTFRPGSSFGPLSLALDGLCELLHVL